MGPARFDVGYNLNPPRFNVITTDERRAERRGETIIKRAVFLEHRPKLLIVASLAAILGTGGSICPAVQILDRVVASIGHVAITASDVDQECRFESFLERPLAAAST